MGSDVELALSVIGGVAVVGFIVYFCVCVWIATAFGRGMGG